ncbi:outer membrane protein assembly factor BamB [Polynucleobacter sp. 30F-ANTBAC]|jgi:outer membrane protein assembly factor BamB|uniref:outer membrane protein assembly factor BamB n=1 Tax=Polynucleobacter sp. 30F-ANTBAC TaxID=2689095 RepID=UPI001C0B0936|nr:outer membrane protein assembly factor BamB [Polynucleobacter sp. 30F-ANTBAC]MBU3599199.1 outer membrane protein assembly factor BamB [Polynucleobacter sp. 30F-ANTBAC]
MSRSINRISALTILTALSIAIGLAGCSSSNKREPSKLVSVEEKLSVTSVWSTSVGKSETFIMRPVVAGDYIYTSAGNGLISKIDILSGKKVWEVKAPSDLSSGPGSDGAVIVVGTAKGVVYAYSAQGEKIWEETVGSEVLTEPLVLGGVAVIRTIDNRFFGLDAKTGKRRWSYLRPQTALALRTSFAMVPVAVDAFVTGFSGGKIGVMSLSTGNVLWETSLAYPKGFSEIERMTDVAARPTLVGRRLCAVAFQGRIGCGDLNTGNFTWTKDFSSYTGTAQSQEFVFAADEKSHLVAYRADDGVEVWRNETMTWRDLGEPLAAGRLLVMGDKQGYLHFLEQSSGNPIARIRVDSSAISAAPIIANGLLIIQSRSGSLAAYKPN